MPGVTCEACVAAAKLRNRDMDGMLKKAKKEAIEKEQPQAVCWAKEAGLYTSGAKDAIVAGATIRHIVSGLQ